MELPFQKVLSAIGASPTLAVEMGSASLCGCCCLSLNRIGTEMARKISGPEKRFRDLLCRFKIDELIPNDGTKDPERINLSNDGQGTSLIKNNSLFSDYPLDSGKGPKNYKYMIPDFLLGRDFIEVKGNISGKTWDSLPRDALNDNMRLAILRMNLNCIPDIRKRYGELGSAEQGIVFRSLVKKSSFFDRYYINWSDITSSIAYPNDNLAETSYVIKHTQFPIKIAAGMERFFSNRLFIVDNDIMNRWEKL
jgi:hypothetical protein